MRFKIFFNEANRKVEVNCLNENSETILLPKNPDQHVTYPIPTDMKKKLQPILNGIIPTEVTAEFVELDRLAKELTDRRKALMTKIRTDLNPKIIETCEQFKLDHAELFI